MAYIAEPDRGVTTHDVSRAFDGYSLYAPMWDTNAWLIDMRGNIVWHWSMDHPPAGHGKLLNNGNLLWQGRGEGSTGIAAASGTELIEVDWDGNELWRYDDKFINHDFVRLDNGNTIINSNVFVPTDMARHVKGGVAGTEAQGKIYSTAFREITPKGDIVWEWNAYEHLDLETDAICPLCPRNVWGYVNSMDVTSDGHLLCTFRLLNTIAMIDRGSGDIIWRWGPENSVGHPHSVESLNSGNILFFDNGLHRNSPERGASEVSASRVLEVDPKTNKVEWEYHAADAPSFYSPICSGNQRLPNGNTFVCEATKGRFFEVTPGKEIVWEYFSPFSIPRPSYFGWTLGRTVFQAHRYGVNYPGLQGRELAPHHFQWVLQEA